MRKLLVVHVHKISKYNSFIHNISSRRIRAGHERPHFGVGDLFIFSVHLVAAFQRLEGMPLGPPDTPDVHDVRLSAEYEKCCQREGSEHEIGEGVGWIPYGDQSPDARHCLIKRKDGDSESEAEREPLDGLVTNSTPLAIHSDADPGLEKGDT